MQQIPLILQELWFLHEEKFSKLHLAQPPPKEFYCDLNPEPTNGRTLSRVRDYYSICKPNLSADQ